MEIHGERQLEGDEGVPLYFAFHRYERSEHGGVSVPTLISALVALGVDRLQLMLLIGKVGYDERDALVYTQMQFKETEFRLYLVGADFPKIVPTSFMSGSVPERVMSLRYTIDLEGEPPTPVGQVDLEGIVTALTTN